jgi:hypothetical protein
MNAPKDFESLKANGRLVVDFPARKLAIFPNEDGQIVVRSWMGDDEEGVAILEPSEIEPLVDALRMSGHEAFAIEQRMSADYLRHASDGKVVSIAYRRRPE